MQEVVKMCWHFCKLEKIVNLLSSAYTIPLYIHISLIATKQGEKYSSCLEIIHLMQKRRVPIIACSAFRAHTEPLYFANKIMNVHGINDYIIGTFMYGCLYGNSPDIFRTHMYHMGNLISEN